MKWWRKKAQRKKLKIKKKSYGFIITIHTEIIIIHGHGNNKQSHRTMLKEDRAFVTAASVNLPCVIHEDIHEFDFNADYHLFNTFIIHSLEIIIQCRTYTTNCCWFFSRARSPHFDVKKSFEDRIISIQICMWRLCLLSLNA